LGSEHRRHGPKPRHWVAVALQQPQPDRGAQGGRCVGPADGGQSHINDAFRTMPLDQVEVMQQLDVRCLHAHCKIGHTVHPENRSVSAIMPGT
jgi:hypothetical protein